MVNTKEQFNSNILIGIALHEIIYNKDGTIFDFKFVKTNKAFSNITGAKASEVSGKNLSEFLIEKNYRLIPIYEEVARNGIELIEDFYSNVLKKNITIQIASLNSKFVLTQFTDLTLYNLLYRESHKYKTLFNNSLDIILTVKPSGEIVDCNEQGLKEYGYSKEEMLKLKIFNIRANSSDVEIRNQLMAANENGILFETSHIRKDGSIFPAEVRSIGIDVDDEMFIFSIVRNISGRKQLIDDLNNKNFELESTLKLLKDTQLKLIHEDKMASIGQLSAGIAHEINNPLGFIFSNLSTLKKYADKIKVVITAYDLLKEKLEKENTAGLKAELENINRLKSVNKVEFILEDLEEIFKDTEEGLDRIRKIIEALRSFAHENINEDKEVYDINEGVKNSLIIARNEIKYNSEVIIKLPEVPLILVRGSEINQVILNIIVNASQAIKMKIEKDNISNEKYGRIIISTYNDSDYVYLCVEDNGIGISDKYIGKVFEPFFTTKPIGTGTGLGLSISYDIIKNKHRGDIIINSVENEGTKMIIKLPIK